MSNDTQPKIDIYSKGYCPYCDMAKALLETKNVSYNEFYIDKDDHAFNEMRERQPSARTVPQIFIGDHYVGGFDDLKALDDTNELDALLHLNENKT